MNGRVELPPVFIVSVPSLFHVVVPVPRVTFQPVGVVDVTHPVFRNSLAAAHCTSPLLLMNVAVLARLNVKRVSSPLILVKSSDSVLPSPPANIPGRRIRLGRKSGRVRMGQIVYQKQPIEPPLALPCTVTSIEPTVSTRTLAISTFAAAAVPGLYMFAVGVPATCVAVL